MSDSFLGVVALFIGVLILAGGVMMPAEQVRDVDVCVGDEEPASLGENCPRITEPREVETNKPLYMVGGGILISVGLAVEVQ
jgi:hypothetical protein